ncbi:MAG: four-helix bundle copper-binding protein [Pseudomonadales bacterium]|nr:four-helix bundle copper-binding protein [Pseudomonadales bacterium]
MFSALTVALAASSSMTLASNKEHKHHAPRNTSLIDAAMDCIQKGQLCRDHCIELVKQGNTKIADCLDVVTDTISMCQTLVQLTVSDSRHLKAFAKVCLEVCRDCEKECRVHKDMHEECKVCMESCMECIEQLEKIA